MALFMRVLSKNKMATWIDVSRNWPQWCPQNDFPSHLLYDWTKEPKSCPSLFRVENDKKEHLSVALAYTSQREAINLDFLLFDESVVDRAGITAQKRPGTLDVPAVDDKHYELPEMTANKVVHLILCLLADLKTEKAFARRIDKVDLLSYRSGRLQPE